MPSPFHLAAVFEDIDGAATLQNRTWVQDQYLPVAGDDLTLKYGYHHLIGAYFGSPATTLTRAVVTTPTLQGRQVLEIQPLSATGEPGSPPAWLDMLDYPLDLGAEDIANFQADTDNAGAVNEHGLVWLANGVRPPTQPPAGCIWARFVTVATAMTADVWNQRDIVPARQLPKGDYEVHGMRAQSTSLIAVRLVPAEGGGRPGVLGSDAVTDLGLGPHVQRFTGMGPWTRFPYNAPPPVQCLVDAADNEIQEVDLLIRKVG